MTFISLFVLVAIALAYYPAVALAAPTAVTGTGTFQFGKIVAGSGRSGAVVISAAGARTFSGTILLLPSTFSAATFTITGNAGKSYTITLPASYTMTSGVNQMTVTSLTASIPATGVIPTGGSLPFKVGGTLTIGSAQKNGSYNGTLAVTVR